MLHVPRPRVCVGQFDALFQALYKYEWPVDERVSSALSGLVTLLVSVNGTFLHPTLKVHPQHPHCSPLGTKCKSVRGGGAGAVGKRACSHRDGGGRGAARRVRREGFITPQGCRGMDGDSRLSPRTMVCRCWRAV